MIYRDYAYSLPSSGDFYNILVNTIAPNFTFTESDLYQALAQVYLYLDGVPTVDENGVLGIEYFNQNGEEISLTNEIADEKISISEDRYINSLITDFQKGDINRNVDFPTKYGFANSQSIDVGVPNSGSYVMRLDHPIREIEKVEMIVTGIYCQWCEARKDGSVWNAGIGKPENDFILDITDYVVEQSIYNNLPMPSDNFPSDDRNHTELTKKNTFYFTKGTNVINISGIVQNQLSQFFTVSNVIESAFRKYCGVGYKTSVDTINLDVNNEKPDTPMEVKFRVKYKPMLQGRLKIEGTENKYNGDVRLDQNSGSVDLGRIGINLFGNISKMGNEEKSFTRKVCSLSNLLTKGKVYIDENNNKWFIDKVSNTLFKDFIVQQISLSKNFNKLSNFIKLNQGKRFNEIDSALVERSEDNYNEYLYFDNVSTNDLVADDIHFKTITIENGLKNTFKDLGRQNWNIDFACLTTQNLNASSLNTTQGYIYIPLAKYGSGNMLCFETSFESPIVANTCLQKSSDYWTGASYYSTYIKYTDNQGFADIFNLKYMSLLSFNDTAFGESLPLISATVMSTSNTCGIFNGLRYYKKPNEIFAFNYGLVLLPYQNKDIFFGENFINNNGLLGLHACLDDSRLYYGNEKYSILDKKATGNYVNIGTNIIINKTGDDGSYTSNITLEVNVALPTACSSWCIADKFGNVLISSNQELASGDKVYLNIKSKHNRI